MKIKITTFSGEEVLISTHRNEPRSISIEGEKALIRSIETKEVAAPSAPAPQVIPTLATMDWSGLWLAETDLFEPDLFVEVVSNEEAYLLDPASFRLDKGYISSSGCFVISGAKTYHLQERRRGQESTTLSGIPWPVPLGR